MSDKTTVDLMQLRTPFAAELVGKLPRVTCKTCGERNTECSKHAKTGCAVCGSWLGKQFTWITGPRRCDHPACWKWTRNGTGSLRPPTRTPTC